MFGILNLDKPAGLTSRTALNGVGRLLPGVKLGHAGTLDPLATGVLLVAVGPATRLIGQLQQQPKRYVGSFRLGWSSDTDDVEGELVPHPAPPVVERSEVEAVLARFRGKIAQRPPRFSALKVSGRRAYQLARKGHSFELEPRPVEIHDLQLLEFRPREGAPWDVEFRLEVVCGAGTYIRALGRDVGSAVGSSAVMTGLRREAVGEFAARDAVRLEELDRDTLAAGLIPPQAAFPDLPTVTLTPARCEDLVHGRPLTEATLGLAPVAPGQRYLALDASGELWAVLEKDQRGWLRPPLNFAMYRQQQRT